MSFAKVHAAFHGAKPPRTVWWAGGDHPAMRGPLVNRSTCLRLIVCLSGNADHDICDGGRVRRCDVPVGSALLALPGYPIQAGDHAACQGNILVDGDTVLLRRFDRQGSRLTVARSGPPTAVTHALAKTLIALGQRPPHDALLVDTVSVFWRHA